MAISIIDPSMLPLISAFLFVFALIFGLLGYVKSGEKDNKKPMFDKKVNALLALAIAAFAVMYEPLVTSMQEYLPIAAVVLVILFFIMFLKNALGGKKEGQQDTSSTFPQIVAIALMFILLAISYDRLKPYLPTGVDPNNVFWGIGIVAVILFFWMIYKVRDQ